MRARADKVKDLRAVLDPLVAATRTEEGCLAYTAHQALDDDTVFVMYEVWRSEEDLAAHARSAHFLAFLDAAPALLDGELTVDRFRRLD